MIKCQYINMFVTLYISYHLSIATFHFHPFVHSVYKQPSHWASLHDITRVPSETQYWGTYTGFNNRPRKPSNYGDLKVSPFQFKEHVMKSFAAMNVTRWKTIYHNYYFIMAWVSTSIMISIVILIIIIIIIIMLVSMCLW